MTTVHTMTKFSTDLEAAGVRLAPLCGTHFEPRSWRDAIGKTSTASLRNIRGYVGRGHPPI
jgi:hypothetical protein